MAQQKNGPVIGLAIFMVLTVSFAVAWYMTWSDNQALSGQLQKAQSDLGARDTTVRERNEQVTNLLDVAGRPGAPDQADVDAEVASLKQLVTDSVGDGTSAAVNLEAGLRKATTARDLERLTATERLANFNQKEAELQQTIVSKDAVIQQHQDARERAEEDLRRKEVQHSEELNQLQTQIEDLRAQKTQLESDFAALRTKYDRDTADLEDDITQKRTALVFLRKKLFEQEDLSFSREDGNITSIDRSRQVCYINLGESDELRIGTTFSVYMKNNSGVGRTTTEDVKGKIEVVDILENHLAEARIVEEDLHRPIANGDPIYSPIFTSGEKMQIAVAGMISLEGKPGSDTDRADFKRLVGGAGADIAVMVDKDGRFTDGEGKAIGSQEAQDRITEKIRYLVIADTGDANETNDTDLLAAYRDIKLSTAALRNEADNHGVYVISLGAFLEHIGYSRKQISWTPGQPFPATLSNGAKSSRLNATVPGRSSSASISGAYSNRRRGVTTSTGNNSGVFGN